MKKVFTLFTIVAAAITTLTGCKDDFPKTPTAEPYLNLTTSATKIALGGEGKLMVKIDRIASDFVDVTLTASSTAITIASPSLSIDPTTTDKSAETTFTANTVGEVTVEMVSDFPGVQYLTKKLTINVVKPTVWISGVKTCEAGKEAVFSISSDMEVIEDVVINLTSSDPAKLTVPETVTLKKGTKNIEAKMTGKEEGEATITITTANEKVEIGKNGTTGALLNTLKVTVEAGTPATPANITFAEPTNAVVGEEQTFTITSDIDVTEDVTFTITSSTAATATVPETVIMTKGTKVATGVYTAKAVGTTTITVASTNTTVVIADANKSFDVTVAAAPAQ